MRKIELLSPARNLELGIEAFNHGADAVYIGAPKYSARAAAGNSISDIERLARYGHQYGGRTYVAVNTLFKDEELPDAEDMIWKLYAAGVDALIIQDLGLLKLDLPPISLHASTQTDNRTVGKVRLLRDLGFTRAVVARELDISQIKEIHEAVPDIELECFVHGALCVSVSGQCYMSEALMGRSANRGVCGQPCRLPMDLLNANGETVVENKHLLCLRDLNRSRQLEKLVEAGVTSLKIEGRLKDKSYVKNVTAYYRRELDMLMERHLKWSHISDGDVSVYFEPNLKKSFNRTFTSYLKDRCGFWNFESPKSVGEPIGHVTSVHKKFFTVAGEPIVNGDGLMVGNVGVRANKTFNYGNKSEVYPLFKNALYIAKPKDHVYRNYDITFERILAKKSADRKVGVDLVFSIKGDYASLEISDGNVRAVVERGPFEVSERNLGQEYYERNVTALGNTIFYVRSYAFLPDEESPGRLLFIQTKVLNEMRRDAVSRLEEERTKIDVERRRDFIAPDYAANAKNLDARDIIPTDFRANAMNHLAKEILADMKLENVADAFENKQDTSHPVMLTRHCLKYALGQCPLHTERENKQPEDIKAKWVEPMSLRIGDKKFELKFGCGKDCYSEIYYSKD